MKIEQNKVVSVNYHLTGKLEEQPEELIEQTSTEKPFVFLYGAVMSPPCHRPGARETCDGAPDCFPG